MFPFVALAPALYSLQEDKQQAGQLLERAGRLLQGGQLVESKSARRTRLQLSGELRSLRLSGFSVETARSANPLWASGFLQAQYQNSDAENGANDAFRIRRARLNGNYLPDARVMGRASVEFASGTNQTTTQIRDAFIQYRPNTFLNFDGPVFTLGQMNTPLGYEISLPSFVRTWPERSQYEQAFFSGERSRGFLAQFGSVDNYVYLGAFNALTVNDPEQANLAAGTEDKIGGLGGVRLQRGAWNGGVSAMFTRRPKYVTGGVTAPEGTREFQYVDLRFAPLDSPWEIKGEAMLGRDRIPAGTASATNRSRPVFGAHFQVDHQINSKDILMLRAETFDRNRDRDGNKIDLIGAGWVHDATQNLRLTGAVEFIHDSGRRVGQRGYTALTLR
ncbi:hypothetical protein EON82_13385, partial [bacterium]